MTREEALIHFEEEYVDELLKKYEKIFHEDIQNNQKLLKDTIIESLKNICEKVCKSEIEDYKIEYFQFSTLRTSIINKTYTIFFWIVDT